MLDLQKKIDASQLSFSKVTASRRTPGVKYVYIRYENEPLRMETPKLKCLRGLVEADGKWGLDVLWHGDTREDKDVDIMHDNVRQIYQSINQAAAAAAWLPSTTDIALNIDAGWALRAYKSGGKKTFVFDSKTRAIVPADSTALKDNGIKDSTVRMIVTLEGVIVDSTNNLLRPVWVTEQILLYPETPANPFKGQYCFLDDEEYLSLED